MSRYLLCASAFLLAAPVGAAKPAKPNIVIILTDDKDY